VAWYQEEKGQAQQHITLAEIVALDAN
jgi:hypothetical protein